MESIHQINIDLHQLRLTLPGSLILLPSSKDVAEEVSPVGISSSLDSLHAVLIIQVSFDWVFQNLVCFAQLSVLGWITSFVGMLLHSSLSKMLCYLVGGCCCG